MKFITLLSLFLITACAEKTVTVNPEKIESYAAIYAEAVVTPAVQEKWARSCALCHVSGVGGAPRMGDSGDWQARMAQGAGVVMLHTIDGFNAMPPLGYCQDCELSDFAAMIKMMSGDGA